MQTAGTQTQDSSTNATSHLCGTAIPGKVLSTLTYGIQPTDPLTFAAVSALLATVALLVSLIPAYRATRIEPIKALREE